MTEGPGDEGRTPRPGQGAGSPPRRLPPGAGVLLGLLALAWVVVPTVLVLGIAWDAVSWAGSLPFAGNTTWHEQAVAHERAVWATVVGAGVPLVGVVLGLVWRRGALVAVSGIAAAAGLAGGFTLLRLVSPSEAPAPVPDNRPPVCQEHSGGDTRCPGG
ncbi:hypothetical protein [Modestobacter sp. SYSU DS0290]